MSFSVLKISLCARYRRARIWQPNEHRFRISENSLRSKSRSLKVMTTFDDLRPPLQVLHKGWDLLPMCWLSMGGNLKLTNSQPVFAQFSPVFQPLISHLSTLSSSCSIESSVANDCWFRRCWLHRPQSSTGLLFAELSACKRGPNDLQRPARLDQRATLFSRHFRPMHRHCSRSSSALCCFTHRSVAVDYTHSPSSGGDVRKKKLVRYFSAFQRFFDFECNRNVPDYRFRAFKLRFFAIWLPCRGLLESWFFDRVAIFIIRR